MIVNDTCFPQCVCESEGGTEERQTVGRGGRAGGWGIGSRADDTAVNYAGFIDDSRGTAVLIVVDGTQITNRLKFVALSSLVQRLNSIGHRQ